MDGLSDCPLNKKKQPVDKPKSADLTVGTTTTTKPAAATQSKPPAALGGKKRKLGFLGNLLGAQSRTNEHMVRSAKKKSAPAPSGATAGAAAGAVAAAPTRTAQEVLADFRQKLEQEMLDFDVGRETSHRVPINLADMTRGLVDEDKARITMEVLKYCVFEQAEEVNEEWIAHKEPSEFMDECVIVVYKEGHAPEEVLEELNRVEVPDEVRGQQKAVQDARQRKAASQEAKLDKERFSQAVQQEKADEDMEALNVGGRDRRSIEEIQRDMGSARQ